MSLKSLIQIIITLIIIIILGGVYYNYFAINNKIIVDKNIETEIDANKLNEKTNLNENLIEKKKLKVSENVKNNIYEKEKNEEIKKVKSEETNLKKEKKSNKPKIDNIVKDIEYLTTDKNGNKYKILATSGRTNSENKNILDLDNVRGIITSKKSYYVNSDYNGYGVSGNVVSEHTKLRVGEVESRHASQSESAGGCQDGKDKSRCRGESEGTRSAEASMRARRLRSCGDATRSR